LCLLLLSRLRGKVEGLEEGGMEEEGLILGCGGGRVGGREGGREGRGWSLNRRSRVRFMIL